MNIKAIIHPAEEGGYWAEVSALPDCVTEGDSMEEVLYGGQCPRINYLL